MDKNRSIEVTLEEDDLKLEVYYVVFLSGPLKDFFKVKDVLRKHLPNSKLIMKQGNRSGLRVITLKEFIEWEAWKSQHKGGE